MQKKTRNILLGIFLTILLINVVGAYDVVTYSTPEPIAIEGFFGTPFGSPAPLIILNYTMPENVTDIFIKITATLDESSPRNFTINNSITGCFSRNDSIFSIKDTSVSNQCNDGEGAYSNRDHDFYCLNSTDSYVQVASFHANSTNDQCGETRMVVLLSLITNFTSSYSVIPVIDRGQIYETSKSAGAGLGKFMQYLTLTLPYFLIGLVFVSIIIAFLTAIHNLIKSYAKK